MSALLAAVNQGGMLDGFRFPLLAGVFALIVTWAVTPFVSKLAFKFGAVDDPKRDDRRVHKEPLPRWGGIGIFAGLLVALLVLLPFAKFQHTYPLYVIGLLGIGGLIVVVGALDDLHQFSAKIQLLFLIAAGFAIQAFGQGQSLVQMKGISWPPFGLGEAHWVDFSIWAWPITAIYIFVVSKTMDTIDGIDGLASGIAAIAGIVLSLIATYQGQPRVAIIAAAMAGASIGFIRHNYNPAKIIMGTGGAQLLGFVLASLSIVGAMKTAAAFTLIIPIFVFGVPLFDAVQVVIRRRMSGVPITQADKRHIHHQLLNRGLTQRQAVWVLYAIALTLGAALVLAVKFHG